jgi:hypothetical protein
MNRAGIQRFVDKAPQAADALIAIWLATQKYQQ